MKKNLIIMSNGRAREINPLGEYVKEQPTGHADSCNCNTCDKLFNDWQKAQDNLKEYEIIDSDEMLGKISQFKKEFDEKVSQDEELKKVDIVRNIISLCETSEETLTAIIL